jgi:hypothetical protein
VCEREREREKERESHNEKVRDKVRERTFQRELFMVELLYLFIVCLMAHLGH